MKSGLEYFPLDVYLDDKFELIEAEFGLTGFAVIVKLFQRIYGSEGYYCEWTNEVALLFGKKIGLGGNVVSEIVDASIKRGIFDQTLYEKYHILTSAGIQKRYLEAVSRRKKVEVKKRYLLFPDTQIFKNVYISGENADISLKNDDISKQSKVEESKVEKSKGKESIYERIRALYNENCVSFPKCTSLSDNRKKAISARMKTYTFDDFKTLFEKAEASSFLKGANGRNWTATFDWLLKDANMAKVLDGNYDDKKAASADWSVDLD